ELCARLNDSHVVINHPAAWEAWWARLGTHTFPFRVEAVNGRAVVTRLYEGAAEHGISVGMVLTEIDGRTVAEIAAERATLASASTPQSRDQRTYPLVRLGPEGSTATLTFRQGGTTHTVMATRSLAITTPMSPTSPGEAARWVDGFGYLNLET